MNAEKSSRLVACRRQPASQDAASEESSVSVAAAAAAQLQLGSYKDPEAA